MQPKLVNLFITLCLIASLPGVALPVAAAGAQPPRAPVPPAVATDNAWKQASVEAAGFATVPVNRSNSAPVANPGGPYIADLGSGVSFNGSGSWDMDAGSGDSIVAYQWYVPKRFYILSGLTPSLSSDQINTLGLGVFSVELTVTDSFGATGTAATTLYIYDNRPFASFSADPNPAFPGQLVTFNAAGSSHGRPDRYIVSYAWEFGDGQSGSGSTVTHIYDTFSSYTVRLTVTDNNAPPRTDAITLVIRGNQGNHSWPGDPTANVPICTADSEQQYAQICSDGSGGAIITWLTHRYGLGDPTDVYAQRVNWAGEAQWTTNGVPICTSGWCSVPQICSDGAGGAIIAWLDSRSAIPDWPDWHVHAQRINPAGVVQWAVNGVAIAGTASASHQNLPDVQYNPQICPDGSGGAIITWDSGFGIYTQRINSAGVVQWTDSGTTVCTPGTLVGYPQICPDGAGGAVLTWQLWSGFEDIYAQKVNSSGVPQWAPGGVAVCTANNTQKAQQICPDGSGGAIITWIDQRGPRVWDVYAQRISAAGAVQWTADGRAISAPDSDVYIQQGSPRICPDGSGGAILTYVRGPGSSLDDIYAQRISPSGGYQWTDNGVPVCAANNYQYNPQICPDGSGGAIITWGDARSGGSHVYAQKVNSAGVSQWTDNGTAVSTAAGASASSLGLCPDGSGGGVIIWEDYRRGTSLDIYAQRVFSNGSLTQPVPISPVVTTDNATDITGSSATLNGTLTSKGTADNVTVSFEWGLTSDNYTGATTPVSANATGTFSLALSSLSSNTTYHYRAKAMGDGTSYGTDRTFATLARTPPVVTTDNATGITTNSAVLNGALTSKGTADNVTVSFEWGLTSDNYTGATTPVSTNATGTFSFALSSLSSNTTYHYRAKAMGDGTSYGTDRTFATLARTPPVVTTDNASGITTGSAVLNGALTSKGTADNVTVSFQWGLTDNYTYETLLVTANATGPFSANVTSLSPATLYHFRAKAVGTDTVYGADRTFATLTVVAPAVTTENATNVAGRSAIINGTLTSLGSSSNVTLSFEWGTTSNYTGETAPFTTNATGPFSFNITGLSENTTYHFRTKAVGATTSYGVDRSFTTNVVEGARIEGVTFEAKGVILGGVTITLDGISSVVSAGSGVYRTTATTAGSHNVTASAAGFRTQTRTLTVDNLTATYTLDFKGNYGLVPNVPDLSYVLACINKWKFPVDGLGISLSKVLSVINAWKFPLP